ncbi:proline dehydrogenase family protein [Mucilaginibacter sp. L196]|uniref:proline dehydrogenase family protein n=1 Tax=Mucilaginibacter sp. L196 TaxID=1641870 RepID=UPI00131C35F1|nr:proline dehydrogenase family protein [Mucilaginibacter sp. L196]
MTSKDSLSFENTEIAFRHSSNNALKRAYWLFKIINVNFLVKIGPPITNFAINIGLPVKGLIKATIFNHFCGGETIAECGNTIKNLAKGGVGTILDYSIEGEDDEQVFDHTRDEIIRTIERASGDKAVPITVFKVTGVGRFSLLEKLDAAQGLTADEQEEWKKVQQRVLDICDKAYKLSIPVMVDAEETWIQKTIDLLALDMMSRFNKEKAIVYNTYQMYRHDKLQSIKDDYQQAVDEGFILGAKIVRGAYMEKERRRAAEQGYPSPIQPNKEAADEDYNAALKFCVDHIERIAFVAGTHNEQSCQLLAELLSDKNVDPKNPHVYFSQLLGMSDNLSFNLANANYNVAKYVPYGPIKAVLPYLFRRAQENTAIAGQMSRELSLIVKETRRRRI